MLIFLILAGNLTSTDTCMHTTLYRYYQTLSGQHFHIIKLDQLCKFRFPGNKICSCKKVIIGLNIFDQLQKYLHWEKFNKTEINFEFKLPDWQDFKFILKEIFCM